MSDDHDRRRAQINLPHARTVLARIARELSTLGALRPGENGDATELSASLAKLEEALAPFDEDPPFEHALAAADAVAARARVLVAKIRATRCRGDRLGQNVRNLFECCGLAEEGARLSLDCGESPDSPLR
jgi:hypothetical protein